LAANWIISTMHAVGRDQTEDIVLMRVLFAARSLSARRVRRRKNRRKIAKRNAKRNAQAGRHPHGKLRFFRHQHPNGTWINVYQLTPITPRKFAAADEFCDPKIPPKNLPYDRP